MKLFSQVLFTLFSVLKVLARFSVAETSEQKGSVAVYWGQASAHSEQNDLSYYCSSSSVDIIVLAFISKFGDAYYSKDGIDEFDLNLSSHYEETHENSRYFPMVGKDIIKCQESGKKVLLSLGGEQVDGSPQNYGFESDWEAEQFGIKLWNYFGEGVEHSHRPFGEAVVDGFDIDVENKDQTGYLALVQKLSSLSEREGSKQYYFSAAPQCPFPDQSNSLLIDNFELDYLFVQFYNNRCTIDSKEFNYETWSRHLVELGYNKTKIYMGLLASQLDRDDGFIKDTSLIIQRVKEIYENEEWSANFGGLMFWDAAKGFDGRQRDTEKSYIYKVWKQLDHYEESTDETINSSSSDTAFECTTSPGSIHRGDGWVVEPSLPIVAFAAFFLALFE